MHLATVILQNLYKINIKPEHLTKELYKQLINRNCLNNIDDKFYKLLIKRNKNYIVQPAPPLSLREINNIY